MTITAPAPNGFLYAYIDTGVPGARTMKADSHTYTAAENYQRFDSWVVAMDLALQADDHAIDFQEGTGLCTVDVDSSVTWTWVDCAGLLCGFDRSPGSSEVIASTLLGRVIPLGAVWLMGCTWSQIELARDEEIEVFRHRRGYGYRFGGSRIFRLLLTMHKDALVAFKSGWTSSGKVTVDMKGSGDISDTNVGGDITGHVLAVESIKYIGPTSEYSQVSMLIAQAI